MRQGTPPPLPRRALDDFWAQLVQCDRNLPALLRTVAQRVVDAIGDGCVLTTISPDGTTLEPQVILHADPAVGDAMREVLGTDSVRLGEGIAGSVASDRRPVLLNDLEPQTVAETTPARFLPFVRDHPMRSLMIVPLLASGELVGTLGAVRTTETGGYTADDLRLLEALAERAALAVADALAAPRLVDASDYEAIYRYNPDGVLLTTPDGHILAANPAACSLLATTERQLIAGGRDAVVVADDPNLADALAARATTGHTRAELTMRRGDGTTFVADVSSTIFTHRNGKIRATVVFRDVTSAVQAREAAHERLAELTDAAERDPLTGLLNRRGFAIAAQHALAAADRERHTTQVVFIDVNSLKTINDTEGHNAGDAALLAMASAIRHACRDADVACRLGGDEFALIAVDTSPAEIDAIVERIRGALRTTTGAGAVSFSFGRIERLPVSELTLTELLDAADRDMYQQRMLDRLRRRSSAGGASPGAPHDR